MASAFIRWLGQKGVRDSAQAAVEFLRRFARSRRARSAAAPVSQAVARSPVFPAGLPRSAFRPNAPVAVGLQRKRRGYTMRSQGNGVRVTATDFLTNITLLSAAPGFYDGTLLLRWAYGPSSPLLQGSRFASLAQLWEKYNLLRLVIHYEPAVATSVNGQIVFAWDNDPADVPPQSDLVRSLYSYQSNCSTSVWEPMSMPIKLDPTTKNLFTTLGTDVRLYSPGQLIVAGVANVPTEGITLGSVWIEYEVELISPSELQAITSSPVASCIRQGGLAKMNFLNGASPLSTPFCVFNPDGSFQLPVVGNFLVRWAVQQTAGNTTPILNLNGQTTATIIATTNVVESGTLAASAWFAVSNSAPSVLTPQVTTPAGNLESLFFEVFRITSSVVPTNANLLAFTPSNQP